MAVAADFSDKSRFVSARHTRGIAVKHLLLWFRTLAFASYAASCDFAGSFGASCCGRLRTPWLTWFAGFARGARGATRAKTSGC